MPEPERQTNLSLTVSTPTNKRPAEEPSTEPSVKKTKPTPETAPKPRLYVHPLIQREYLRMKAELQKTKQDLATETAKSSKLNNQINVLCAHACKLTDRYYAALTSNAALEEAYKDVASDSRAYKGALDIVNEEFKESREDNDLLHNLLDKRDDELELVKKQLKEAKEELKEAKEDVKVLTSMFKSLGEDHEVGRAVYDMLLLHVEGQYGEDKVVLEKMKKALEEAFGGSLGNESE